jgi:dienelactone hydrolase
LPYLQSENKGEGTLEKVGDCEYYQTNKVDGKKAILMVPDVWGWNSGRIRALADYISEQGDGFCVVIPKLLDPALNGGTDGDALPPNYKPSGNFPEFKAFMATHPFEGVMKQRLTSLIGRLTDTLGMEKIYTIGVCFGSWVTAHLATCEEEAISGKLQRGVAVHPSIHLEETIWEKDTVALCSKAKVPTLFMPCANDPDRYREEGDVFEALKTNHLDLTKCSDFKDADMMHGFFTRGDNGNEAVQHSVERATNEILAYFA